MPLFSENDKNLLGAIKNNKIASLAFVSWIFLFKKENTPTWALDILAEYLLMDDYKDIGQFDHVHHWATGYVLKVLTKSKKLPTGQRKQQLAKDLASMFHAKGRQKFMRR